MPRNTTHRPPFMSPLPQPPKKFPTSPPSNVSRRLFLGDDSDDETVDQDNSGVERAGQKNESTVPKTEVPRPSF